MVLVYLDMGWDLFEPHSQRTSQRLCASCLNGIYLRKNACSNPNWNIHIVSHAGYVGYCGIAGNQCMLCLRGAFNLKCKVSFGSVTIRTGTHYKRAQAKAGIGYLLKLRIWLLIFVIFLMIQNHNINLFLWTCLRQSRQPKRLQTYIAQPKGQRKDRGIFHCLSWYPKNCNGYKEQSSCFCWQFDKKQFCFFFFDKTISTKKVWKGASTSTGMICHRRKRSLPEKRKRQTRL